MFCLTVDSVRKYMGHNFSKPHICTVSGQEAIIIMSIRVYIKRQADTLRVLQDDMHELKQSFSFEKYIMYKAIAGNLLFGI